MISTVKRQLLDDFVLPRSLPGSPIVRSSSETPVELFKFLRKFALIAGDNWPPWVFLASISCPGFFFGVFPFFLKSQIGTEGLKRCSVFQGEDVLT